MSEPAGDHRIDQLRQQLRALGYLDAGVNRFVLGPAVASRRPAVIALLASVRVGLVAAVLLGPAAAIGLDSRLPGLVTGPRDALVIALYMGALFGAAVSIAALAASLMVASLAGDRVARRASRLSNAAGAAVAIGCVVYLTLWWRTANAGFGWSAPGWTGFALLVAVAISLLLGQAVRATAFAVITATDHRSMGAHATDHHQGTATSGEQAAPGGGRSAKGPRDDPRGSAMSWRMSAGAGVLAFAGAAWLLVVTAPKDPRGEPSAPLAVVSSGARVRLIAIDGFDAGIFEALAGAGRVPALAAALSSARARLTADDSGGADAVRDPARTWTTIATGQPPDVHGVGGLETRRIAGLQGIVPAHAPSRLGGAIRAATGLLRLSRAGIVSGNERREKTLWEVAAGAGLRTAVVNWWATWPAPEDAGTILTDRAALRLERGGTLDAEIAPAGLYEPLRGEWAAIRQEAARLAGAAFNRSPSDPGSADSIARVADAGDRAVVERSAGLDALQLALAREISTPAPDLTAVYLPGLDIAQHALLAPADAASGASRIAVRFQLLRDYYVFLDRLLAESLAPSGDDLVIVITEPGRIGANADGLMGVAGRIAASHAAVSGRATDVMPTVLHALGVPLSRDLPGTPLTALFTEDFARRYPVRHVVSYGHPSATVRERKGQPLDQEMIDRLRSLGYVR